MGKEYEAEAEMKLCPRWEGGSQSAAGCWWHSQQNGGAGSGVPGGAPTAAEAQSSVRGMPAGMSVPVEREVGRSPDH